MIGNAASTQHRIEQRKNKMEEEQGHSYRYYVYRFLVITATVFVGILIVCIAVSNFVLNHVQRRIEMDSLRDFLIVDGVAPRCMHFKEVDATLVYYLFTDGSLPGFKVIQWFDSNRYTIDTVPNESILFGVYSEDDPNNQNFFAWNTTDRQSLAIAVVFFHSGKPLDMIPIVLNSNGTFVTSSVDTFGNSLFRTTAALPFLSDPLDKWNFMAAFNGLDRYQIRRNLSLAEHSEDCYNLFSYQDTKAWNKGKRVIDNSVPVITIVVLLVSIAFVTFRKRQPLRSRLPLLMINSLVLLFLYTVTNIISIASQSYYIKNVKSIDIGGLAKVNSAYNFVYQLLFILTPFCMLTYTCHICRYYYLKYFYAKLATKKDISTSRFMWYRRFASNTAFSIYAALILAIFIIVYIPLQVKYYQAYSDGSLAKAKIWKFGAITISEAVYLIVSLFIIICVAAEVISNWRLIIDKKTKVLHYFFYQNDPFYFRLEMVLFAITLPIFHIQFGISANSLKLLQNINFFSNRLILFEYRSDITISILLIFITFIISGGIAVVMHMVHFVANRFKPRKVFVTSELEDFLLEDVGYNLMNEFAKSEWSTENLLAWKYFYRFKVDRTTDRETVMNLFTTFIKPGSEMELNLPNKTRKRIINLLGTNGELIPDTVPFDANFESLYNHILENLSDTMARLSNTSEYKQFEQSRALLLKNYSLKDFGHDKKQ